MFMQEIIKDFELYAQNELTNICNNKKIINSINYTFFSNAKRIRPLLMFSFSKTINKDYDLRKIFPAALAIEMIHTYSLIHDDLPCMDNARIRRNKLTNHLVYGEAIAVLAGDALLAESYRYINKMDISSSKIRILLDEFINVHGIRGMLGGQSYDIQTNKHHKQILNLNQLKYIHMLKTGKLFEFCLVTSLVIHNINDKEDINSKLFFEIVKEIGILYQAIDDLNDQSEDIETGKAKFIDVFNNKITYLDFMSKIQLEKYIEEKQRKLLYKINKLDEKYSKDELINFVKIIYTKKDINEYR